VLRLSKGTGERSTVEADCAGEKPLDGTLARHKKEWPECGNNYGESCAGGELRAASKNPLIKSNLNAPVVRQTRESSCLTARNSKSS